MTDAKEALGIALQAAEAAGQLLQNAQENIGAIRTKSSAKDWVTKWDLKCEDVIRAELAKQTPSISILGEEQGRSGVGAEAACWLVDPIDGTVNFAHGLAHFAVSIALELEGQVVAGVTFAPKLDWLFAAARGDGATFNGARMRVSSTETIEESMLATGFPYDRATSRHNFKAWDAMQCKANACRRFGAATLDLAMVANGWIDGYWESRLSPWDLAAGSLLVEEAGGQVTSITGGAFSPHGGQALASNGIIHPLLIEDLAEFDHN